MKSRDVGGGHYSTEYKKYAYVVLNWIHFINNYCVVHFLTLIYGQSDPDENTDLGEALIISFSETYFCFGIGGGPKTTKVNFW